MQRGVSLSSMRNIVEEGPPGQSTPVTAKARGIDATELLRLTLPVCATCSRPLDGHSYRFYACHPVAPTDASDDGTAAFLQAIQDEDWATVQATQMPALDQPLYVLYAIACPHPPEGSGMVALLLTQPDAQLPATLSEQLALTPQSMAALRAQCPTCPWISFTPPLHFRKGSV